MPLAPLPTPLQQLGGRRFSFYPPIRNVEHNEWIYRRSTWSEVVVVNTRSSEEACVPRAFLGEISFADAPFVVVRLRRELEFREGMVGPYRSRVIELPVAVNQTVVGIPHPDHPAPVISIRLEPRREARASRLIGVGVVLGAMACLIVADIARSWISKPQVSAADNYARVVHKFGTPASDRTVYAPPSHVYRVLSYPWRHASFVLMGSTRDEAHYIGTLDSRGHVREAARLPDGSNTGALLRSLPLF
ncbi:MAG TPA: hypothetical protein VHB50_17470 [Bryobacteraceae bacterium]|nr:hypothetical protein [Bryobacteraceae bacterium]